MSNWKDILEVILLSGIFLACVYTIAHIRSENAELDLELDEENTTLGLLPSGSLFYFDGYPSIVYYKRTGSYTQVGEDIEHMITAPDAKVVQL